MAQEKIKDATPKRTIARYKGRAEVWTITKTWTNPQTKATWYTMEFENFTHSARADDTLWSFE